MHEVASHFPHSRSFFKACQVGRNFSEDKHFHTQLKRRLYESCNAISQSSSRPDFGHATLKKMH